MQHLKDLGEQALENNPGIRRAFEEHEAALQRIPQLTSLPDPMVGITQYLRSPKTRVGPQNTMLSISQAGERRNLAEITQGVSDSPDRPRAGKIRRT